MRVCRTHCPQPGLSQETLLRKHRIQTAQQEQNDAFPALRRYMQLHPALQQVRRGGRLLCAASPSWHAAASQLRLDADVEEFRRL